MELGKTIREKRIKQKIELEILAENCKVSLNEITNIEDGKKFPNISLLRKIAEALNVTAPNLLFDSVTI